MNSSHSRSVATVIVLVATFCSLLPGLASAHGAVSGEDNVCKLTIGKYQMNFTGYQPEASGSKAFCDDIPRTGHTIIALDAINQELRSMPLEIHIIRDTGEANPSLDAVTVLYIPPTVYPTGSLTFENTYPNPEKFIGIITAHDGKEKIEARFPFSVAEGVSRYTKYLPFLAILIIGGIFFWYSGMRNKDKKESKSAPEA